MVSGFISRLVILIFGTLYPAYASYKAVRTKNVKEYVKWMMYWIVFALFTCAETFTDLFLGFWFPFYYEIKIITVIYLLSPATKGSSILYRKFVHPVLTKREQEIDEYIAKMKEQGYHTMINLGSKGVNYATSLIMQTAIRGGGGLVNQLKKSYSLNDLSDGQNSRKTESGDSVDSSYNEESGLIRRNTVQNRHSVAPSTGQSGLYFPEANINQLQDGEGYRQISAYEKMDPGYSTGEPYYYGLQQPVGPPLVRTSSLGPSSRIRTRASTKHVLPKRSSLSEGGSTWSAMEPRESQNETENYFNFPLSHSASFPLAFYPFQHLVSPEYQSLFGNFTQNQMFTFINSLQPVQSSKPLDEGSNNEVFVNPSETISEEISINSSNVAENIAVDFEAKNMGGEANVISKEGTEKTLGENEIREDKKKEEIRNENDEEAVNPVKSLQLKDNSIHERSGRYNKKPAPTPPAEESTVAYLSVDEDEAPFFTPNASPKPSRKCSPNTDVSADKVCAEYENRDKFDGGNVSHVPKKNKSKMKKTDFNIQKKLHMPFQFSFWHPKERKQFSAAEAPSVANVDISTNADSKKEYFIPLRDESKTDGSTDGRDQDL